MSLRKIIDADHPEVSTFVSDVFSKHEPMCKVLKLSAEEISESLVNVIYSCCRSGLSCAFTVDHKIVAVALALKYDVYKQCAIFGLKPIATILKDADILAESSDVYLFMIASRIMNRGYARQVLDETIELCKRSGYSSMSADATNIVSQYIFTHHFRFINQGIVYFKDYDSFKNIIDTPGVMRVYKTL